MNNNMTETTYVNYPENLWRDGTVKQITNILQSNNTKSVLAPLATRIIYGCFSYFCMRINATQQLPSLKPIKNSIP